MAGPWGVEAEAEEVVGAATRNFFDLASCFRAAKVFPKALTGAAFSLQMTFSRTLQAEMIGRVSSTPPTLPVTDAYSGPQMAMVPKETAGVVVKMEGWDLLLSPPMA